MNKDNSVSITLLGGYTDREGVLHTEVTIGKRLTTGDMLNLDYDSQAQNPIHYEDLTRRLMITKFGTLRMPVPLTVMLALDSIDSDDINKAISEFLQNENNLTGDYEPDEHEILLPIGFFIDSVEYQRVQFGNRVTRQDYAEAANHPVGLTQTMFLIGRQISKISTADNSLSIVGQVDLERFKSLDASNIGFLRMGAELFRQSFRFGRKNVSGRYSTDSLRDDEGNRNDGKRDSKSADGTV